MNQNDFFTYLKTHYSLNDNAIDLLQQISIVSDYEKGDYIICQDKKFHDLIFILEGVALTSLFKEHKEYISNISFETDLVAIPFQPRAQASVVCLETVQALHIPFTLFESLMVDNPDLSVFGYRLFKEHLRLIAQEYFDYIGLDAKDAYDKILRDNPRLLHRVPLKYIAANLGVTPSSLSRLRATIARRTETD